MQVKKKISVIVSEYLLEEVDRLAGNSSRSVVFEQALISWLRKHRQAALNQAIERYYRSLSHEEGKEDVAWAALGDETVRDGWWELDE